jgi:hypothetical protein
MVSMRYRKDIGEYVHTYSRDEDDRQKETQRERNTMSNGDLNRRAEDFKISVIFVWCFLSHL